MTDRAHGGGLGDKAMEAATSEPLSGTGGSDGGGAIAGSGDSTGGRSDQSPGPIGQDAGTDEGGTIAASGRLAGQGGDEEATEAAALGAADGSLADAAQQRQPGGTTIGDALGSPGRDIGSGTPGDRGELGGGGPGGLGGGTGPAGTASPGGHSRR